MGFRLSSGFPSRHPYSCLPIHFSDLALVPVFSHFPYLPFRLWQSTPSTMGSFLTDGIGLNLFGFEGVREFGNQASQRKADFLLHSDLRFENNRRHYRCQFRSVKTCYLELSFGSVAAWGYQATKCSITVGCCLFFSYFTDLTPCFS